MRSLCARCVMRVIILCLALISPRAQDNTDRNHWILCVKFHLTSNRTFYLSYNLSRCDTAYLYAMLQWRTKTQIRLIVGVIICLGSVLLFIMLSVLAYFYLSGFIFFIAIVCVYILLFTHAANFRLTVFHYVRNA